MHKNTKYPLVPFEQKTPRPPLRDVSDLTESDIDAEMAIQVAHRFFQFDFEKVRFSGRARYCSDYPIPREKQIEPPFGVEIWRGEDCLRAVGFWAAGIEGILYAEIDGPIEEAIRQDIIGGLLAGVNEARGLPRDTPREYTCTVDDWDIDFNTCFFP